MSSTCSSRHEQTRESDPMGWLQPKNIQVIGNTVAVALDVFVCGSFKHVTLYLAARLRDNQIQLTN